MEALGPILSMLCAFAGLSLLVVAPFVGVFYWAKYEREKWLRLGAQLGLTPQPSARYMGRPALFGRPYYFEELVGVRGGLTVRLGVRVVVRNSGRSRSRTFYTYARVDYGRSLDIGLSVSPRHMATRLFDSLIGESDVEIGDPEVDPYYSIHGSDVDLLRRLFTVPYLNEALRAMRNAAFRPYLSDASLRCERRGKSFDPGALSVAIDSAVDLARRVIAARQAVGASSAERAVDTVWRQVASARGFELDVANTRMSGRFEAMHVEVDAQLRRGARWTVFTVRFDHPLGLGLRLTRQGALSGLGKLLGAQDIETGDPIFDKRFVVKGAPEAVVRGLLTPDVRARLVELQERATELEVVDDRLSAHVAWLVADATVLESGIAAVAKAGAALAQVSVEGPGPYRR